MVKRLNIALVALAATFALFAAGCSTGDHDSMGSHTATTNAVADDADHNEADVQFAQGMIVHHGQAVQMSDIALTNSTNPKVLELAKKIKEAQEPEIVQMTEWLVAWGQPVPDTMMDHSMMNHGDMSMTGMISKEKMDAMMQARGENFDTMFLESMVEHHLGAIQMAQYALDNGKYPPLKDLASEIIRTQNAEILEIQGILS
jgi:uncharacterized protein (DUF305 family)